MAHVVKRHRTLIYMSDGPSQHPGMVTSDDG